MLTYPKIYKHGFEFIFLEKFWNNWILINPNTKSVLTAELAGIFPHAIQPHWEYCDPGVLIWIFTIREKTLCQFDINRTSNNLCKFPHSECEIQSCLMRISVDFFLDETFFMAKICHCPNVKSPHRMEIIFDKNVSKNVINLFHTNMMHTLANKVAAKDRETAPKYYYKVGVLDPRLYPI